VYWKTVFQALEDRFECWLLNAHHFAATSLVARPTSRTRTGSASSCSTAWSGRALCRRRRSAGCVTSPAYAKADQRARAAPPAAGEGSPGRRDQALQRPSTTYSKSARAILEALLSGVTDPEQLAELSKGKMRPKIPQLREALQSRFQIEHHGIMVAPTTRAHRHARRCAAKPERADQ